MSATLRITGYELDRLEVPTGRVIGDSNCAYDGLDVVVVRLKSDQGAIGWGYGECMSKGRFSKPAWWVKPGASLDELGTCFEKNWWPHLQHRNPFETRLARLSVTSDQSWLDLAVRMALWDLMAKQVGLPLHKMLGGHTDHVKAYGSILDFNLDEDQAVELAQRFVQRGFKAIKVKVGSPEVARDIQRLLAVKKAVGGDIELTADANVAWDAPTTIQRMKAYKQAGIRLGYIEDPIPHDDIDAFAALAGHVDVEVIGHDYASTALEIAALLQTGALQGVRCGCDIDTILDVTALAQQFGVRMIFGNSLFEINVHAACALSGVDRLEFSDLAWNKLVKEPVRFKDGFALAPTLPGHGLELRDEALADYRQPDASEPCEQNVSTE